MNQFKRLIALFLTLAMLAAMAMGMAGCNEDPGTTEGTTAPTAGESGDKTTYTVSVKSAGGLALAGVDVYVYADSTLADLKQYGETDENGNVSLALEAGSDYAITLSGTPKGYVIEPYYTFSGTSAAITLTSQLVADESLSGATLGLGDVMYDFSVVNAAGETITLSEMLAEKKAVLINFWFSTCGPCATEFPYMEEAYQMYQDSMGIIALDPLEDNNVVSGYQQSMGLSFPMAACPAAWSQAFGITGYPTSIVVDRYGVICLIEVGGITSLRPFTSIFSHFTAEDYEQKICVGGVNDVITAVKPTYTMPTSDEISAVISSGETNIVYRAEEGESAELTWPFIITEKNGEACVKASNQLIEDSYAILYADVTLKAGQAVGFDYLISSEQGSDIMFVIVNDEDIYQISGVSETEQWAACYPWVAIEDGTYEVALCYLKDEGDSAGDDTVYIKNMRIVEADQVDTATFIPRQAAATVDGFEYTYVDVVLNEEDGYYHVGTEDGPLLLANLLGYTQFSEEQTAWLAVYDGGLSVDGVDYADALETYANFASNSSLTNYCTVNEELGEILKAYDKVYGFDEADENEWLRLCSYYQVYGSEDSQLEDPIKGLAPFSAYEAKLGTNVESNYFYYNRIIMPRGLVAEFVPTKSGVYRITSRNDSANGVDGWIFDENRRELLVYEQDERMFTDSGEVSMVYYMEAGKAYYIDIAFWDPYEVGYIYYDIEYLSATREHFRLASPGYFTYDSNATGEAMYHLIAGGIDVVLGEDGIWYHDLGNGEKGSKLYADFTGITSLFSNPISTVNAYNADGSVKIDENGDPVKIKGMIELGGFDFSKTEYDLYVLGILNNHNGDVEAADAYLKELWGADYESYAQIYMLDDVFNGIYHGEGEDLTAEMEGYLKKIITTGGEEARGCVVVDERLAEILHLLVSKYTFENVDNSWTKLCYYYDYLGPEK